MPYAVEFRQQAIEDLERFDRVIGQRLLTKLRWLSENVEDITPVPLTGEFKGSSSGLGITALLIRFSRRKDF